MRCARGPSRTCLAHYSDVFMNGNTAYAIPAGKRERPRNECGSWRRLYSGPPGRPRPIGRATIITYTNNWPYEPLVGNRPTGESRDVDRRQHHHAAGGNLRPWCWWYASQCEAGARSAAAAADPLGKLAATPSQRATVKYFWVVAAADPGADC